MADIAAHDTGNIEMMEGMATRRPWKRGQSAARCFFARVVVFDIVIRLAGHMPVD